MTPRVFKERLDELAYLAARYSAAAKAHETSSPEFAAGCERAAADYMADASRLLEHFSWGRD